jgi:hypothetical protein
MKLEGGEFFIFFLVVWLGISVLLSAFGGWLLLARNYRHRGTFTGSRHLFVSGQMRRFVSYSSCLIVGSGPEGMYLSILFPFRVGHPPVLIPWQDVSVSPSRFTILPSFTFSFAMCPSVSLRLYRGTTRRLAEESKGSFVLPEGD